MFAFKIINLRKCSTYIICVLASLSLGLISALLSGSKEYFYTNMILPAFTISGGLFTFIWVIAFALLGVSAYKIHRSKSVDKDACLIVWAYVIALSFLWPIPFFRQQLLVISLILIFLLLAGLYILIKRLFEVCKPALYIMILYTIFIIYSAYLNIAVLFLN